MKNEDVEEQPVSSFAPEGGDEAEDRVDTLGEVFQKSENGEFNMAKFISKRSKTVTTQQLLDSWQIGDRKSDYLKHEMYVEYLDKDMKWKLGQVDKIYDGPDVIDGSRTFYEIHDAGPFHEWRVRAARAGLEAYFGAYPWVFQQVMLLRVEQHLRFQPDHEDDLDNFNIVHFARGMWDAWVEVVRDELISDGTEEEFARLDILKQHILSPFVLMQSIADDDRTKGWDFLGAEFSVYTYFSMIGTGSLRGICILAFQLLTPLVIFYSNMLQTDNEPTIRFEVDPTNGGLPANGRFFPSTDFETFCHGEGRTEGRIVLLLVLLVYNFVLVPDSMLSALRFYTGGAASTTKQRIDCIRRNSWLTGRDSTTQEVWYRMDYFMNTAYVSLLYGTLIFTLLNTEDAISIVLNAFAFGFIHKFDEEVTKTMYWDEDRRWMKAATVAHVIKNEFAALDVSHSGRRLAKTFGLDPEIFVQNVGNAGMFSHNLSAQDNKKRRYFTFTQMYGRHLQGSERANDLDLKAAEKPSAIFGAGESMIGAVLRREWGIFQQYRYYRVWSRWTLAVTPIPGCDKRRGNLDRVFKLDVPLMAWDHFTTPGYILRTLWENLLIQASVISSRPIEAPWRIFLKLILGFLEVFLTIFHTIITCLVLTALFWVPICF